MGLRFWRTRKLAPGIRLNLSKSGASVSVGPRGAKVTVGTSGVRWSVGLPGTGLSYRSKLGSGKRSSKKSPSPEPRRDLKLSFFERMTLSGDEQSFVQGLAALKQGDAGGALAFFEDAESLIDATFLAGVAAFQLERLEVARHHLQAAFERAPELGSVCRHYEFDATLTLPIVDGYEEEVGMDGCGAGLLLGEVCQALGDLKTAGRVLESLARELPRSPTVALSLAEVRLEQDDPEGALSALTDQKAPEPLGSFILAHRARALRELGMAEQGLELLSPRGRRRRKVTGKAGRAVAYERARAWEALGEAEKAKDELERIYVEDPDFADVRVLLSGIGSPERRAPGSS